MKNKSLFLILLFALFMPWAAKAQVTIGDLETAGNDTYLPMNSLYNYSYSQQLYTADEIGTAGTINAITIWMYGAADLYTIPFDIYMVETDKESFTSTTDWESVTSGDIVYSGSVTVHNTTAEAYTFELATPFAYSGTGNLLIAFDNNCGQWKGGLNGKVFTATDNVTRSIYGRDDNINYDPTNMSGVTASAAPRAMRNVIEIDITPGGGPTCDRPESLVVSDITGYGATFHWESEVGNYAFEIKKASETDWNVYPLSDNTLVLSTLEPYTNYNARVKAVCSADLESGYRTANFTTLDVCPEGKICIGEGTATNSYLPTYNYYNYSLTEQIYTAEEIGQAGAIESVDIYSVGTVTRTLEFYMVSTEKETFTDGTDWIAATASDLVYNGSVTFAANSWNTIEFDNPFIYDGRSNVALIVRDMTGSYVSSINFYVFDAPSQAIRIYRDASAYDLANPGGGTVMDVKNRVRLVVGEPPACPKPTGLTVNYTGGTEATISWTSDATAWNMRVNGTPINGTITNPYTLTGLELATTYEVEVQANCGDATSEWAGPVSFKTDNCMPEDMCALTFVVTDSYGDGWNDASIQIYDYTGEELGDLLATVTNENLDGLSGSTAQPDGETQTITLNFCNGQELAIFWVEGGYDDECSYTITDLNGDVVAQDDMELGMAYTIDCAETDCRRPTDFVASEIGNHSVKLSWTENGPATSWVIEYLSENDTVTTTITVNTNPYILTGLTPETAYAAQVTPVCEVDKPSEVIYWTTDVACPKPSDLSVTPYPFTADVTWNGFADAYDLEWALLPASESKDPYNDGNWYYYDNGTYEGSVGLGGGEFHWGVMFPAGTYEGTLVSKVKAYDINAMVGTLAIYNDGETAPANQISIQDVEFTGAGDWVEFETYANIDPSKNVWIVFDAVDGAAYPIGTSADDNGDANGRWVEINGTWYDMASVGVEGRANMLRAYIEEGVDPSTLEWNPVSGITSPYTIEGLQPETTYVVRVKAVCGGDDGESAWTMTTFTTPSACDMPNTFSAEVEATSATLSWVGYQESYNLRYRRTPYVATTYFSENFDEGLPTTWTTIDNDTTTVGNWIALSEINNVYTSYTSPLTGWAHSGDDAVASASFVNGIGAVATDNYLVTPQVTFNGKLRFYATSEYEDPDTYEVLLSTTGNSISDFNVTLQAMGPATYNAWDEVIIDLSDYAGQQGYIAIHHVATDKYWLVIDDFGMYDFVYEDWTNVTATENTYTATGLTPEAEYEWQVQGVNASCGELEWTEVQTFTTPEQTTVTQTIALVSGTNWVSLNVDITLDDLKAALQNALGTANATLKSKEANIRYTRGRWGATPANFVWDVASMYMIEVGTECEFTVEGMPIDPTEHPIIITGNGVATWIGFPFSESMTLTDAFAGFATNGDAIKGKLGNNRYARNRWSNSGLTTMEPGQGYIYTSAATEDRILVYPSASKVVKSILKPMMPQDPNSVKRIERKTFDIQIPQAPRMSVKENLIDRFKKLNNK